MEKLRLVLVVVTVSALTLTGLGAIAYAQMNPRAAPQGRCGQMMSNMGGTGMMGSMDHGTMGSHGAMHAQCQAMMNQEDMAECETMMNSEEMAQCQTMMQDKTT